MCRAVPRLAAHMLGYAGKSLVRRKNWRKGPFRAIFSEEFTGLFLLGPVAPKVIKGAGDLVGKVSPSSPYVTM